MLDEYRSVLNELDLLMSKSFKDPIVWEQKGTELPGRYVYIKYEQKEIGLFMGYHIGKSGHIRACVVFIFPHSTLGELYSDNKTTNLRLFHKILIRSNLKLKGKPYRLINGKSPALIRTLFFDENNCYSPDKTLIFFSESINAIRGCQALYKVLSN